MEIVWFNRIVFPDIEKYLLFGLVKFKFTRFRLKNGLLHPMHNRQLWPWVMVVSLEIGTGNVNNKKTAFVRNTKTKGRGKRRVAKQTETNEIEKKNRSVGNVRKGSQRGNSEERERVRWLRKKTMMKKTMNVNKGNQFERKESGQVRATNRMSRVWTRSFASLWQRHSLGLFFVSYSSSFLLIASLIVFLFRHWPRSELFLRLLVKRNVCSFEFINFKN